MNLADLACSDPASQQSLSRDVSLLMLRLTKSKHFAQLHSLIKAIYAEESALNFSAVATVKEHFKLILLGLGER